MKRIVFVIIVIVFCLGVLAPAEAQNCQQYYNQKLSAAHSGNLQLLYQLDAQYQNCLRGPKTQSPTQRSNQGQTQQQQKKQQMLAARQRNFAKGSAPAMNRNTGQVESKVGTKVVASNGKSIWFPAPFYVGAVYVILYGVGYVEMDDRYDTIIYPALMSGDPERITDAELLIEGSAEMQGLTEMTASEGDL